MDDFYFLGTEDTTKEYEKWVGVMTRQLAVFRTEAEQRKKLREKGCPEDYIEPLINLGIELGAIDDRWYGRMFVQNKGTWSSRRLRDELRHRGLSEFDIQEAFAAEQVDDKERCALVARRLVEQNTVERKAIAALLRRGFPYALARDCFADALGERED